MDGKTEKANDGVFFHSNVNKVEALSCVVRKYNRNDWHNVVLMCKETVLSASKRKKVLKLEARTNKRHKVCCLVAESPVTKIKLQAIREWLHGYFSLFIGVHYSIILNTNVCVCVCVDAGESDE